MGKTVIVSLWMLLWALAGIGGAEEARYALDPGGRVAVMTRNLYVGTDLFRLLAADVASPFEALLAVGDRVLDIVDSDFPERSAALAREIEEAAPDIVGIQEASLLRGQYPGDFLLGNPEGAEVVLFDFLSLLEDALRARGLDYRAAVVLETVDIELPALVVLQNFGLFLFDVRLTDRDAVLVRQGVEVSNVAARLYAHAVQVEAGGAVFSLPRGFEALDAAVAGRTYRFVNTHIEVRELDGGATQGFQVQELMEELAGEARPVILVGDLNSLPSDPAPLPYGTVREAGFVDIWQLRPGPAEPGFTCCQAPELTNADSALRERIDFIFVRNDLGELPFSVIGEVQADLTGAGPVDRTPSGLWPSDHAGVAADVAIPLLTRMVP